MPKATAAATAKASAAPKAKAQYWLMKSEPDEVSVDDFAKAKDRTLPWTGVRNYQARNFMRDSMRPGDGVLFYHSSCPQPGVVGLAEVAGRPVADETQFQAGGKYFDPKATREAPRWVQVDIRLQRKTRWLGLPEMRATAALAQMRLLQRGNRLSITPVTAQEWQTVLELLGQ